MTARNILARFIENTVKPRCETVGLSETDCDLIIQTLLNYEAHKARLERAEEKLNNVNQYIKDAVKI